MKNPLHKLQSGVQALFNRVVNGESLAETARKPGAIASLMAASAPAFAGSDDAAYATTLATALKRIRTKDLETLIEHNVAVGLDPRLGEQRLTSRERPVNAIYYSRGRSGGTLALPEFEDGFIPFNAREILQGLATRFRDGDTLPDGQTLFATRVTQAAARTVVTYTNWYVAERFPDTAVLKNPGLKNPPAPRP